jgi:hypothetical protein
MMLGIGLENPSLNLRAMVQHISKKPASRRKSQAIDIVV